jgi:hypothetical protein
MIDNKQELKIGPNVAKKFDPNHNMYWICDVTIPDDALIKEFQNYIVADKVILSNLRSIFVEINKIYDNIVLTYNANIETIIHEINKYPSNSFEEQLIQLINKDTYNKIVNKLYKFAPKPVCDHMKKGWSRYGDKIITKYQGSYCICFRHPNKPWTPAPLDPNKQVYLL